MRMIKVLSDEIRGNIHEAREKIKKAYEYREKDKATADWYKEMAAAHMRFNDAGHNVVVSLIKEAREKMSGNPMMPGMLAVYEEIHADIAKEAAEVQAMIAAYK